MKGRVLADTGPLYAAADPSDKHHTRALDELRQLAQSRCDIIVSFPILLEAYSLVRRRFDSRVASGWLSEIMEAPLVNPAPEDYRQAAGRVREFADQRITLFDATLAGLAMRMRLPVWTYDPHFDVMRIPVWRRSA